ncbi:hypothetical protein C8R42DRAFT_741527, partial [Lentinula raphanica]
RNTSVNEILVDPKTTRILEEACCITGDIRSLAHLFMSAVMNLKPTSPWLTVSQLELTAETQRICPEFPYLQSVILSSTIKQKMMGIRRSHSRCFMTTFVMPSGSQRQPLP